MHAPNIFTVSNKFEKFDVVTLNKWPRHQKEILFINFTSASPRSQSEAKKLAILRLQGEQHLPFFLTTTIQTFCVCYLNSPPAWCSRLPACPPISLFLSLAHWSGPWSLLIGRLCLTYEFSSLLRPPSSESGAGGETHTHVVTSRIHAETVPSGKEIEDTGSGETRFCAVYVSR